MNDKIIDNFKLGDKVWFSLPKKSKIPGIIESDRIQSVGKQRDIFIDRGFEPFVPFTKISPEYVGKVTKRRKEFPGETNRIRLHHMGMEREYIDWKKKGMSALSEDEESLLRSIKNTYDHGAYEKWYTDKGHSNETIRRLIDKGLIYRHESTNRRGHYILVPKGETYG